MNEKHKAIRRTLRRGSPVKALSLLGSIGLPEREYNCVLWHDLQDKDMNYVADMLGVCERHAKRIYSNALSKISDTIE